MNLLDCCLGTLSGHEMFSKLALKLRREFYRFWIYKRVFVAPTYIKQLSTYFRFIELDLITLIWITRFVFTFVAYQVLQ